MMKKGIKLTNALAFLFAGTLSAQEAAPEDPAHDELRALHKELVAAIVEGDVGAQLKHVHPDVVVTWQNHVVCRGVEELNTFMKESGSTAFRGYKVKPEADDLTVLHGGDTGISNGRSVGMFHILGKDLEFENRWTATLVKEGDRWLVASYHVSLNALDNPVLNGAKGLLFWVGGGAGVLGLILGWLVGRKRKA